jgi:hypothetical protein
MISDRVKIASLVLTMTAAGFTSCQKAQPAAALPSASASYKPSPEKMEKLLTVADIERITGVKGLQRIHGQTDIKLASQFADLQFGLADGHEFIRLDFYPASQYGDSKTRLNQIAPMTEDVKGIGDGAFTTPGSIAVKTGNRSFAINNMALTKKIVVTPEQFKQLALIVLSRL